MCGPMGCDSDNVDPVFECSECGKRESFKKIADAYRAGWIRTERKDGKKTVYDTSCPSPKCKGALGRRIADRHADRTFFKDVV